MPSVVVTAGFDIRVYTSDRAPAHVHVYKAGARIKVLLEPDVAYVEHAGPASARDIRRAVELVGENVAECIAVWRRYHG